MNLSPPWRWLHTAIRPLRRVPAPEAADMGTAFGLDASVPDLPDPTRLAPFPTAAPRVSPFTGLPRKD